MPVYKRTIIKKKSRGSGTKEVTVFDVKCYYKDFSGATKQKMKRGFEKESEAKAWERNFLEQQHGSPDMTFQSLYDIYIEDVSHRLRVGTIEGKKCIFENRILPYFGTKPINQIKPKDIREWQNILIGQGYSDSYLDRISNMIVTIFNYAVTYYGLPSNPCDKAGRMGKRTRSMNFWTLEQYKEIIQNVENETARMLIELLFYSGMRCGECFALLRKDFDFNQNTINIDKSYHQKGNIVNPPKTENGYRVITMPQNVMDDLKTYFDKFYDLQDNDRVFPHTRTLIRNHIRKATNKTGIPYIRIHDLRHSHVSLLIDMGFSPHLIAERIGDTVALVQSVYGHLYPNKHKEVADRLNELA